MPMIKISPFGGIVPRTGERLIGDSNAVVANNIKLQSGNIKPLRVPKLINEPNKPLPALSIFRAWYLDQNAWLSWPTDVDAVRVPLSSDVEPRFVWSGDGIPKIATYTQIISSGDNDYPATEYALGIPAPIDKVSIAPSGGVGAATTRVYTYTYFSILGEESAPAPVSDLVTGKVDDTWAVTGMSALPVNSGNISAIVYSGNDVTITTIDQHFNRAGEQIAIADVTTVTNVNGTWTLTEADQVAKTMKFTVSAAPTGVYNDATDTVDTWTRTVPLNLTGMKRRLYRSTGLTGTIQLVSDDVGTSYNDTLSDANILGDELISSGWVQPPVGLKGFKVHSSGAVIAFVGNLLCLSEPYQPHAWPIGYQMSTDSDIVAIGTFGSEIGIGTKGTPYMASGVEPASMASEKINSLYPCLSKRSMIEYGDGLVYASAHGLVYAGSSGVSLLSDRFYAKDEWQALNPASMVSATAYGRLYISYQRMDNSRSMIILDGDLLVTADIQVSELYADESTSELFVSDVEGIKSWDSADTYPLNASWRSKDFVLPAPANMAAAKIEFDAAIDLATQTAIQAAIDAAEAANAALLLTGNIEGGFNFYGFNENGLHATSLQKIPENPPANKVTFVLRKNQDEIVISRVVENNKAFRLPDGYKSDVFSIEVFGQCLIKEIRIADSMDGLRNA
jgi:ribosome biogenesis protein Tsr3